MLPHLGTYVVHALHHEVCLCLTLTHGCEDELLHTGGDHLIVEASALRFTQARQQLEISPEDARSLGLKAGQRAIVTPSPNGHGPSISATVALRSSITPGIVFLQESIAQDPANALTNGAGAPRVLVRPA